MKIATMTINPVIDVNVSVHQVLPEKKLRCFSPVQQPGGGGINVSRALAKLDQESRALFPSGGASGQQLEALLQQETIRYRAIDIQNETRRNFLVYEENSGRQFRFGMPGPQLQAMEWKRCLQELEGLDPVPEYLVASGSLPPGVPDRFYQQMAETANKRNIRVIVDGKGMPLKKALHSELYALKPNMRELSELMGMDIRDEDDQERAVTGLLADYNIKLVILSLGAAGVLAANQDFIQRFRAPGVPVKSKVGAGDSMVAGILYGLVHDMPLQNAIRYGVAAGTAAVMTPATELCQKSDTDRLFKKLSEEA